MIQLLLFLFLINYVLMNGYDYDDSMSGGMIKWIKRSNKDIHFILSST
jgi:hypothetical protein